MKVVMLLHYLSMIGAPGLLVLIALFKVLSLDISIPLILQGILALMFSIIAISEQLREKT